MNNSGLRWVMDRAGLNYWLISCFINDITLFKITLLFITTQQVRLLNDTILSKAIFITPLYFMCRYAVNVLVWFGFCACDKD